MKIKLIISVLLINNILISQEIEKINKPERVIYNYTTTEINNSVKNELVKSIKEEKNYEIISDKFYVGPLLWHDFKSNKELTKFESKNIELNIDKIKIKARLFESIENSKNIWDEFKKIIINYDFVIRKANFNELEYYWTIISWDIDEPLLVLETSNKRCFILDFEKKSNKLFWLDEYSPNFDEFKNLVKIEDGNVSFSENLMEKETKLITVKLLNTDEELKQNVSVSDMKMIMENTNNIFKDVVKKSEKFGNIIVEFELTKNNNNINVVVTDELETSIKIEFENRLKSENFPNTKKKSIKFIMLYIVNSINKF